MTSITDYHNSVPYPTPSGRTVLVSDELTDSKVIIHDIDKRRAFVVLVEGESYGTSVYDMEQQERFLKEDRLTSLYSSLARASCKVLATVFDPTKRLAILQGIVAMTNKVLEMEEYKCERLARALNDARGPEAMELFKGNTILASAEACYLTYPTFHYTPLSGVVGGIKVENAVLWGKNELKFVMSHEDETPDGHGQKVQRWLSVGLTEDWKEKVDAELRKFTAIVDLLKEQPRTKENKPEPAVEWTCETCGKTHRTIIPRMYRGQSRPMNIKCGACQTANNIMTS
ncbi:hypothetical protein pEaSNUABM29_00088 [Erwinia phage pEa_SNUABM_29]|nr:hypothetical protein pEaSNUABM29_00088 [Erwinia phage pEa_SNUABM_29]